jgi:hypothetical protein
MAANPKQRRTNEDEHDEPAPKKGNSALLMIVGGGCGVLLLCLACSGGGVGIWWWKKPATDQVIADAKKEVGKIVDDVKAKNPLKLTGPVVKVADTELDPPVEVWDFTLRAPKGLGLADKNKRSDPQIEHWSYRWQGGRPAGFMQFGISKSRLPQQMEPIKVFLMGKLKSEPGDVIQFDTVLLPQPIEINGLEGARMWRMHGGGKAFDLQVHYRYHVDGWLYTGVAQCGGDTEAKARENAEVADAAFCSFRKR